MACRIGEAFGKASIVMILTCKTQESSHASIASIGVGESKGRREGREGGGEGEGRQAGWSMTHLCLHVKQPVLSLVVPVRFLKRFGTGANAATAGTEDNSPVAGAARTAGLPTGVAGGVACGEVCSTPTHSELAFDSTCDAEAGILCPSVSVEY
jgi:hypothetical protein